jgi:hypothetical protein
MRMAADRWSPWAGQYLEASGGLVDLGRTVSPDTDETIASIGGWSSALLANA